MKKLVSLLLMIPLLFGWAPLIHAKEAPINEEIIYKIFVDRFNNGDPTNSDQVNVDDPYAYHGGDIQGIINRLDYLKELGFTTISLSPIMENAEGGYHGYWIEDFFAVEEQFGTMDDLKKLVNEAHDQGMKVILEFVPNYVAKSHPFAKDPSKTIQSTVADKMWLDQTVTLNLENNEVKKMLMNAADFWLTEADIDGFNIHAIEQTPISFLSDFVHHLKEVKPDIYLTGNVLNLDDLTKDYLNVGVPLIDNPTIQKAMVNVLTNVGTPPENIYKAWKNAGEPTGLLYVDNKFTERFTRKIVENGQNPLTTWKLALTYMYTSPGVPEIFQGSAIPMDGDTPERVQQLVQFNQNDQDLQNFYNKIASMREKFPVLAHGDFEVAGSNGAMTVFKRYDKDSTMFIAINNDTETQDVFVTDVPEGKQLTGLLGDNIVRRNDDGKYRIALDRESAEVYIVAPDKGLNWLFISLIVGVFVLFALAIFTLSRKQKKRQQAVE